MFERLSDRLEAAFRRLRAKGRLSRADVDEGLREIRAALLEADVALPVVRRFVERVRERAVGEEVLRSLTPGQQVVKVVHEELVSLLGGGTRTLELEPTPPTAIVLVGLQGSGKTTAAAKLAFRLRREGRRVLVAACDLRRPAAVDQLRQLASRAGVDLEAGEPGGDPVAVAARAAGRAAREGYDVLVVDSAGRLHVDAEAIEEARRIRDAARATHTLLVLDAMTGQDAVAVAEAFGQALQPTGAILTKLDGDARGGAALSLREATGVPILYAGVGERPEDLEPFHPDRMASRILGMGDVLSLIERAEAALAPEEAAAVEAKVREGRFDLEDFLGQLQALRRMGPLEGLLGHLPALPGIGRLRPEQVDERQLVRVEAIIRSMTPAERARPEIIDASRRRRIASGSGTRPQDVNRVLEQFAQMRRMLAQAGHLPRGGRRRPSRKARRALPKMKGF